MTLGIGLVGYGYWGPNLARNINATDGMRLAAVCDTNPSTLARALRLYPGAVGYSDLFEMIKDPAVDAVVVASPVRTHAAIALAAMEAGRHVLVEKPMATTSSEAMAMIETAARRGLTLMVDHTFVYNGAVGKISDLLGRGELGRLLYYDSVRINLGLFQSDVDVLWDLAVHDLSILDYLHPELPEEISCIAHGHFDNGQANMAYLTLLYGDGMIAHTHVNWLSPVKIRQTVLGGDRRMVVYNDMAADEKVKLYDCGVSFTSGAELSPARKVDYRSGDITIPVLDRTEALAVVVRQFRDAILTGAPVLTDGQSGLRVVQILEAAQRSMMDRCRAVPIFPG